MSGVWYLYACLSCGHRFERTAPMGEAPKVTTCPECSDNAERRPSSFTAPAFPGSHAAEYRGGTR